MTLNIRLKLEIRELRSRIHLHVEATSQAGEKHMGAEIKK